MASFAGQNWLIVPAPRAVNEPAPSSISKQLWLVVLSGVYVADVKGDSSNWRNEKVVIEPDIGAPLRRVISQYGIPRPPGIPTVALLQVEQWSPFAAVGAFSESGASTPGVTVNVWRPELTDEVLSHDGQALRSVFKGMEVDVAVRDKKAMFHRISYHITLLGRVVFARTFA
jgi:hypothetical protein